MSTSSQSNTLINVTPGVSFKFHSWGDEHIVYDSGSGSTHLVDELTYYTLQCVKPLPCEAIVLYKQIAEAANLELDENLESYLGKVVSDLAQNKLIELQSA